MGLLTFQVNVCFEEHIGFSPLGDREAYPSVASGRRERVFDVEEKYERARIKLASDYSILASARG